MPRILRITNGNKRPAKVTTDCAIITRGVPTTTDGYGIVMMMMMMMMIMMIMMMIIHKNDINFIIL